MNPNGAIPGIQNPLDPFGNPVGYGYYPVNIPDFIRPRPGQIHPDNPGGERGDILGIGAVIKDAENRLNENLPSYLVGIVGLVLIGAGIYSLAK